MNETLLTLEKAALDALPLSQYEGRDAVTDMTLSRFKRLCTPELILWLLERSWRLEGYEN